MLGDPSLLAGVIALVILASLGLGLLISVISDSERQAVQLSLLSLLASVFLSGFVLVIAKFTETIPCPCVPAAGDLPDPTHPGPDVARHDQPAMGDRRPGDHRPGDVHRQLAAASTWHEPWA